MDFSDVIIEDTDLFWYSPEQFSTKWGRSFNWNTFADLKPYKIGVVAGYGYSEEFQKAIKRYSYDIDEAISPKQNFLKLALGRVDIIPSAGIDGNYIINNNPELKGKVIPAIKPFRNQPVEFYMAFSKKSKAKKLLPKINKVILDLQKSGFIDRVFGKVE
ncbi:MAG: ABC transporter substrate-binding protein [Gammaproteobacteria bacterium]|nr:ABC transporter substrate-binding protein [Gammaproteobacteria bacterium]